MTTVIEDGVAPMTGRPSRRSTRVSSVRSKREEITRSSGFPVARSNHSAEDEE